mmetsp:Transcript_28924/g.65445  ORF Transcript_28924/g.65445 Transcript_28924/m.65445 type:complete len:598 (+) Transcript_28924:68-1861(+)
MKPDPYSPHGQAMLVAGCSMVCVHGVLVLRRVLVCLGRCQSEATTHWATTLARRILCGAGNDGEKSLSPHASEQLAQWQEKAATTVAQSCGIVFSVALMVVISCIAMERHHWLTSEQDLFLVGIVLLFTVAGNATSLLRRRLLVVWYAVLMVMTIAWARMADTSHQLIVLNSYISYVPRLVFSLTCPHMPTVVVCNLAYAMSSCLSYATVESSTTDCVVGLPFFTVLEVVMGVSVVVCTHHVQEGLRTGVQLEDKANVLRVECDSLDSMLKLVSDAVVRLDVNLFIKGDCSRFAALLAFGKAENCTGAMFEQFMPFEDRQRFSTHMQDCADVGCLHVHLRDSNNCLISVEVINVAMGPGADAAHLVSIREFADQPRIEVRSRRSAGSMDVESDAQASGAASTVKTPSTSQVVFRSTEDRRPAHNQVPSGSLNLPNGTSAVGSKEPVTDKGRGCEGQPTPNGDDDDAPEYSESMSSDQTGSMPPGVVLSLPHLLETSRQAKDVSILQVLVMWNIRLHWQSCCPLHAAVAELDRTKQRLERWSCRPSFQPVGTDQCRRCGYLDVLEDADSACGDDPHQCRVCGGQTVHHGPPANLTLSL